MATGQPVAFLSPTVKPEAQTQAPKKGKGGLINRSLRPFPPRPRLRAKVIADRVRAVGRKRLDAESVRMRQVVDSNSPYLGF